MGKNMAKQDNRKRALFKLAEPKMGSVPFVQSILLKKTSGYSSSRFLVLRKYIPF